MKAVQNDTTDGWNGAKKVMNRSEKERLLSELRAHNLDLAVIYPPLFQVFDSPGMAEEILTQLRLLHSTIQVKLNRFDEGRACFSDNLSWDSRLARRRP
jgi:hypothetical protein